GAIKTPDGGYLIWGDTDAGTNGKQDGFLMRLDKDYNQLWYKTYGGFSHDNFESAVIDEQGNILVGGTSMSFGVSIDSNSIVMNPSIYAVYVNGNGELLWQKTYNGNPSATNIYNTLCKVLLLPNQNFALIGSTNNYTQQFGSSYYYVPNAFIQCINKQGDTLWHSNYNYYDTVNLSSINTINYMASNATLSPDGNIEMLMVLQGSGDQNFPMSLVKVAPNSTSGYNKYISRKPIKDYFHTGFYPGVYYTPFFPMTLVSENPEIYIVAAQTKMILCNSGGTMLKEVWIDDGSAIQDMLYNNSFVYFANNNYIIKTDLNGTILWNNTSYGKLKIDKVKGVFIEKDNSLTVFCSYNNAVGEKDLAMLRLSENGQLILK
ncbi:MAG: hypothetical protein ACKVQB_00135, partial [Bacteroidia bacterium]